MPTTTERLAIVALASAALVAPAAAIDCTGTSVGLTPLNDLAASLYLGQYQGGLYPGGLNTPPEDHAFEGRRRAALIRPLNTAGQPDPAGAFILLSIGMSNTTQEFCGGSNSQNCQPFSFMGQAAAHPMVKTDGLVIIDGARGGQSAGTWDAPDEANYNRIRDQILAPRGLSEAQVQAAWVKVANPRPTVSLPAPGADAFALVAQMGDIVRAMKTRYPNLRTVFLSSRIYAGYADTTLNPEPFAYESAFAVKWLIEAQFSQAATGAIDPIAGDLNFAAAAPWLAWGPYLWADGLNPRSDGLIWQCSDFANDGTHPGAPAREKVGTALLDFMLTSPFSRPWFTQNPPGCPVELTGDGVTDVFDLLAYLDLWFARDPGAERTADVPPNINIFDLLRYMDRWFAGGC